MTEREPENMMFFITGGSASGKSEYAEKLAEKLAFSQGGGQKTAGRGSGAMYKTEAVRTL